MKFWSSALVQGQPCSRHLAKLLIWHKFPSHKPTHTMNALELHIFDHTFGANQKIIIDNYSLVHSRLRYEKRAIQTSFKICYKKTTIIALFSPYLAHSEVYFYTHGMQQALFHPWGVLRVKYSLKRHRYRLPIFSNCIQIGTKSKGN